MKVFFKTLLCASILMLWLLGVTHAQESLPYEATFEASNGFVLGDVNGQRGLEVIRGKAEVIPDEGQEGTAALKLLPSRPNGIVQLSIDAGFDAEDSPDKVIYTDFHIRPGAATEAGDPLADVEGSLTGFFKVDDAGELYIYDGGTEDAPGQWLPTGTRFSLDDEGSAQEWIRLSFRQDFEAGIWDVAINGNIFRANLAMERQAASLERIEFIGQSRLPLWIDGVHVSRQATAYTDRDRDGLPDDWEGDGLTRDADPDEDGLTNIEELVLQTKPLVADTDGDGTSDGDEYLAGYDPLTTNVVPDMAAQTYYGMNYNLVVSQSAAGGSMYDISIWWPYETVQWRAWVYTDGGNSVLQDSSNGNHFDSGDWRYHRTTFRVYNYDSVGFVYIWAEDWQYGFEDALAFTLGSNSSQATIPSSVLNSGNLGSQQGANETLSENCPLCETTSACGGMSLGSIRFSVPLGNTAFDDRKPVLMVHEREWSDRVYSRASLRYTPHEDLDHGYSPTRINGARRITTVKETQALDWVQSETVFTKIEDERHGYVIKQYTLDQVQDGQPVGEPYNVLRLYNPDPFEQESTKRLIVEKTEDGRKSVSEPQRFIKWPVRPSCSRRFLLRRPDCLRVSM